MVEAEEFSTEASTPDLVTLASPPPPAATTAGTTGTASVPATPKATKAGKAEMMTTFSVDDPVWLTDPVAGVLQGVVVHVDKSHVGVQLTGPSLGKGGISKIRRYPQQGLGLWVHKRNFVAAPVDKVYQRLLVGQAATATESSNITNSTVLEDFLTAKIEDRQAEVMKTTYVHTQKKKGWSPRDLFRRKQPKGSVQLEAAEAVQPSQSKSSLPYASNKAELCKKDLQFVESLLSAQQFLAFCIWDPLCSPHTAIVWASPAFAHLTGQPIQNVLGRNLDTLRGQQTDKAHMDAWEQALRQHSPCHMVAVHYRPNGQAFFHRLFLTPLSDTNKKIRYYLSLHSESSPIEAGRINRHEGWPMPAIFNLKGQEDHVQAMERQALEEDIRKSEASQSKLQYNPEDHPPVSPLPSKDEDGLPDVSKWMPEFSLHKDDTKPESPKKKSSKTESSSGKRKSKKHTRDSEKDKMPKSPRKEGRKKTSKRSKSPTKRKEGHHPEAQDVPKTPRGVKAGRSTSKSPGRKRPGSPRKAKHAQETMSPSKKLPLTAGIESLNSASSAVSSSAGGSSPRRSHASVNSTGSMRSEPRSPRKPSSATSIGSSTGSPMSSPRRRPKDSASTNSTASSREASRRYAGQRPPSPPRSPKTARSPKTPREDAVDSLFRVNSSPASRSPTSRNKTCVDESLKSTKGVSGTLTEYPDVRDTGIVSPRRQSHDKNKPVSPRRRSGENVKGIHNDKARPASPRRRSGENGLLETAESPLSPHHRPRAFNDIGWTNEVSPSQVANQSCSSLGSQRSNLWTSTTLQKAKNGKNASSTETVESDSDDSDDSEGQDEMGLFRGNSIGDLHDVLFNKTPALSTSTHHTMTSFSEGASDAEPDQIFEDNYDRGPSLTAPTSSNESYHSDASASISEVHNVLYNQPSQPSGTALGVTLHSVLPNGL